MRGEALACALLLAWLAFLLAALCGRPYDFSEPWADAQHRIMFEQMVN